MNFSSIFPVTEPTWIFLGVLCIVLFAPLLFNKLRMPHIIGMILAGLMIGPNGLNILERDSSFELFGKVGLYYIMFLASLEINMQEMKQAKNGALLMGLAVFSIPIILGLLANTFILKFDFIASLLLASMYASYTLISYPIVARYGLSRLRCVNFVVGGAMITDTLTLFVLAIIAGLVIAEEEYIAKDGSVKVRNYVASIHESSKILNGDYKVPAIKKLPQSEAPASSGIISTGDEPAPF